MAPAHFIPVYKPKKFLGLMSLRTGTQLITLAFLINKLTGLYGLLAIATGYEISGVQLSMYIYSLIALGIGAHLAPHIRKGPHSPFQNLALAWLYLIDSAVNLLYTFTFGLTWFLVLAQNASDASSSSSGPNRKASAGAGGKMMDDTAGWTNPSYTVSAVDVVATSTATGAKPSNALIGKQGPSHASDSMPAPGAALTSAVLSRESMSSLGTITALWLLRVYTILVVLAYARAVLRQHIVIQSQTVGGFNEYAAAKDDNTAHAYVSDNPFAKGTPAGAGWRGALGRMMLGCGKNYWLGMEDASDAMSVDEEWARSLGERFSGRSRRRASTRTSVGTSIGSFQEAQTGAGERERRRRAGTGPPPPPQGTLGLNTNVGDGRSGSVPRKGNIELGDIRK
ncbi:MAG: hypothetical protein Q9162_001152 [Coniocarpon cinnabarinum]